MSAQVMAEPGGDVGRVPRQKRGERAEWIILE